jgi:hypothetical protein
MNCLPPYVLSLLILLLFVVRERQNKQLVMELLNRLMIKEGYAPISDTADPPIKREPTRTEIKTQEQLAAAQGKVHFRMPIP